MPKFNTRVELHKLGESQHRETYAELHAAMERAGFRRTISSSDGDVYHLPHAEYKKETGETLEQVQSQAKNAANSVHTPNGVITWEYTGSRWEGLIRV